MGQGVGKRFLSEEEEGGWPVGETTTRERDKRHHPGGLSRADRPDRTGQGAKVARRIVSSGMMGDPAVKRSVGTGTLIDTGTVYCVIR